MTRHDAQRPAKDGSARPARRRRAELVAETKATLGRTPPALAPLVTPPTPPADPAEASDVPGSAPARGRPRDPAADQAILRATFAQLLEVGYGALSMEAVATDAGVAKTTVYRRFPSKRDLVIAALSRSVPFIPPARDLPTHEALRAFCREAVHMLIESGAVRILASLLVEAQRDPTILAAFRERLLEPRRGVVIAMLRRGIERGELRPDADPLIVTEMIAGAVFGHHAILGHPVSDAWIDDLVAHVWAAVRLPDTERAARR